jgi:hypothetical protein
MMVVLAFAATWMIPSLSTGQTSPRPAATAASAAQPASALRAPAKAATEQGIRWRDLKPTQQAWLKPLELDWPGIDTPQKQKWLQVAAGFPKMSPAEQSRVQARMADWAKLTPQERGRARMNFQEATQLSAPDRQARWDAYQALPPEEKRQLAARAAPRPAASAADATRRPGGGDPHPERADKAAREAAQTKSNIVPNPALASRPKAVSPVVVQASPGATTTTIAKRPAPPSHQQAGLPKIAATPEFVDQATLLPQRGPQGAAAHSETPSSGVDRRRP